ncbi:hypothetical protein ACH4TV_28205 [Streptomyces sp. NPDC020898]|uniref:hypothetical protein n=1 Tax=Streptomyces sp. NPDC020898 TaxID=3365101 RepID=UPI003789221C
MTATTPFLGQEDVGAPSFVEHLLKAAVTSREQAAVQALVEEERILTNDAVRRNLVRQTDDGGIQFCWQFLAYNLHSVGLDESGRAFVNFILSMAWCGQTSLVHVRELDERRLAILLRAMIQLSGNDNLAITVHC